MALIALADRVGDNRHWNAMIHVEGQRQEWIIWGFKRFDHKMAFDIEGAMIMAAGVVMAETKPLGVEEN